ncbi:MAG: Holliday junction branch migration DNA helicase RuvB [Xenococcaceae cyanobacterium MO_188.B32]|nr:Holliday junction branch migration DNA helicase RuvB [Xenococcaceae cyanobacterium MO_188.B32]
MAIKRNSRQNSSNTNEDNYPQRQNSPKTKAAKKSKPKSSKPTSKSSGEKNNLLSPQTTREEIENSEEQIRPHRLADYIGQKELKGILNIAITAAKGRQETLDHLLLYGPPGLGKTTMSLILASEMGVNCKITAAPSLERPRDITGLLVSLQPGDILFIDEIHRLNRITEELLYPAMEDYRLDITIGKGQSAKTRSIPLPPFTLVGATTKVGSLTSPLRDRFGLIQRLRFYELDELVLIVKRTAEILKTVVTEKGAEEIARRSRGTPRIANRLLRRVRDYVQVQQAESITSELAAEAMDIFDIDACGLDWTDRLVLGTIIEQFNGGPVGLEAVAASTGEDAKTIEEVYEPYLLQIGYLNRTHRGRIATEKAYEHLGYQGRLF